ncbi:MAG: DUF1835 domain-containing protein [Bacillaceae bacterium]|jgi:Domain of unknown function (DUF1835)./Protein of unknown function.|uniref:DUF1835 domain-containing protein n=1 Tax=Aeribacillus TaxID=1055323 RepID=UPI0007B4A0AE|nr:MULTISPECIES: DUF1835 domain-containing protein [Aeribacillus]REJ15969.1 MAG: DUF1835 domain-containing protein [Bacillaceae bacterium]KZM57199.1 hypothetical protein A3Q35_06665 [Aeribacillus pallidus]MDR9792610.1 DUF1835 domain-containing protein [Aeribacillus pallidus]RZI51595.1 DUF1835 domain-containing protein [Aeribacillus pallidus]TVZ78463.1 uncharacterized protein DUF1835 [Aeribacillus composti]
MIHILLGASPSGSLKMVLRDLDVEKKERVISFWETFSVGPIWRLHEDIGKEARFHWIKNNLTDAYNEFHEYEQNFQKTVNEITAIPEGSPIMIWISDNAHEQTGLRFVLYLLKNKNNDIFLINTTKVYGELFKKRKEKYTVLDTGEIPPEKLRFIYEQSKNEPPLSQHERENFEKEWLALANTREVLRIWQNGTIHSVSEDYYDLFIINRAKKLHNEMKTKDFIKSVRLIGEVLGHLDQYVGDEFLEYRLRKLIEKRAFEMEGSLEAMAFYSVKLR